jgi:hypothetical protein
MAIDIERINPLRPQYNIPNSPEDSRWEKLQEITLEFCETIGPPLIALLNLTLALWWVFFRPPHPTTTFVAQVLWFLPLLISMIISLICVIWQNCKDDAPDLVIATLTGLSSSAAILRLLKLFVGILWSSLKPYPESDLFEIFFLGVFFPGVISIPALVGLFCSWYPVLRLVA